MPSAGDVEHIHTFLFCQGRKGHGVLQCVGTGHKIIGAQPQDQRKIGADGLADCFYHHQGETAAIFEAATKLIGAEIGEGRKKLA